MTQEWVVKPSSQPGQPGLETKKQTKNKQTTKVKYISTKEISTEQKISENIIYSIGKLNIAF